MADPTRDEGGRRHDAWDAYDKTGLHRARVPKQDTGNRPPYVCAEEGKTAKLSSLVFPIVVYGPLRRCRRCLRICVGRRPFLPTISPSIAQGL